MFGLATVVLFMQAPIVQAQMHDAATEEQKKNQEEVAERAKELLQRFTNTSTEQPTQPTEPVEQPVQPEKAPFDPGPVQPFAETQTMDEPVSYLPDSGFGISVTGLALGLTTLRHHKRLTQKFIKLQQKFA